MGGAVGPYLRVAADLPRASAALAAHVAERARASAAARGRFRLVVSGGSTPVPLYRRLAARYRGSFPWARTEVYFGDERCVGPRHPESNYAMVAAALLERVPVPRHQVHRIRGELRPPARGAADYARWLVPLAEGSKEGPLFDLVLLGIGTDGHTASLFPGSAALDERRRTVVSVPAPERPPPVPRITLTLPALARSREVCFLVAGPDKADAVAAILGGRGGSRVALPAARVRSQGPVRWYLDRGAAAGLSAARRRELDTGPEA